MSHGPGGLIWNHLILLESSKNNTESFSIPFTELSVMLISHITVIKLVTSKMNTDQMI